MTTQRDIIRRNARLLDYFKFLGLNVRLKGNENNPAVILNDTKILSCFVKNFELNFTTKRSFGEIMFTVNLEKPNKTVKEVRPENISDVYHWLKTAEHESLIAIKVKGTNLKFSGYFTNPTNGNKNPMFTNR